MIPTRLSLVSRDRGPSSDSDSEPTGRTRCRRRHRPRRIAGVLSAAVALTMVAAACGDDAGNGGGVAASPDVVCTPTTPTVPGASDGSTTGGSGEKITLGYSAWPGWFPWKIAEEKGLFAENGANVELQWFDNYLASLTALSSGAIDANSQTLNDTLISVSGGAKQVIVLTNDNSTGNDQIIAAEGIADVAGLKGKKVAVEAGTVDHFLLLLALQKAGLTGDDVQVVPLPTDQAAAAFKSGSVDAVGAFAPFTTTALERPGSKVVSDSSDFPGAIPDHLVVDADMVTSNPEGVQALVNTWFDVLTFIKDQPDEAVQIMATRADVSIEDYKSYDAGTTIFSLADNVAAFTPGATDANLDCQATKISRFLVSTGLAKEAPSLDGLFDTSFIENVKE